MRTPRGNAIYSDVGRFAIIPEWLLDAGVSSHAVKLFAVLAAKYADKADGVAYPSRQTLADAMHCSPATIDRASKELQDAGAVGVYQRFAESGDYSSNAYVLHFTNPVD